MLNWSGWILGYNTVCAKESRALQTNWSSSLCIDVTGSRDLFPRYQCWFRRQGRKYSTQSAITFLTDSIRRDIYVRVRFFGKIQIRIFESKHGFWVFRGKSKNGSWIHKIHTQGGFFGSNPNPDFWDSQSERFFGKGFEKLFLTSGFSKKKWSEPMLVAVSLSHIIPCLSSIQIIGRLFLNPYLSVFCTYVVSAYAGLFSKLKIKQFIGFNFKFL